MAFNKSPTGAMMMLLLSSIVVLSSAYHIMPSLNYMVDVEVNNNSKTIEFFIHAVKVTGWVGIGVNYQSNMIGADLFIGGFSNTNNQTYGNSYYNAIGNGAPALETPGNWELVGANETGSDTYLRVKRNLKADGENDTAIEDKPIYLIFAYKTTDDNFGHHDVASSYQINLITGVVGDGGSGAEMMSVAFGTLLLGLVATVLKY